MAAWRVARSILVLHAQLQRQAPRAAPPATARVAWGTIGDTSHTNTSDHSPHDFPGWDDDVVTAGDIPHAPALGLDFGVVAEALRQSRDMRIKYVIFNRRMFSYYAASGHAAFTWRPYTGLDPHTTHGHVSVVGDQRADGEQPWSTGLQKETAPVPALDEDAPSYQAAIWLLASIAAMSPTQLNGSNQENPNAGQAVTLVADLLDMKDNVAALLTSVAAISARLNAITAPEGGAPFTDAQLAQLRALIESTEDS